VSTVQAGGEGSPYVQQLLQMAPRVLGMLDREPLSPTRGCMDRTYWAWKFKDFPGARFQEGLFFLSFLHQTPLPENSYLGSGRLLSWIAGGFEYWCRIQRRRGDFDEAYPHEGSLAATAFTSFYLSEAFERVSEQLLPATASRVKQSLVRAGSWLLHNDERHGFLSNHLAAAAAALLHVFRLSGEARFERRSRFFLDKVLSRQSREGWYEEYAGADPGYQTHGSLYLARIWQLTGDTALLASLERSFEFLAHFVHPDGSLGGEYASRNTQTYYPAAFEMLADRSASAAWIATAMRPSVTSLAAAGLGSVDRTNLFPLLNNYVFAELGLQACSDRALATEGPSPQPALLHFADAGILKVRRERYDLYLGLRKGGVIRIFDRRSRTLAYADAGYIGRRCGKLVSSQWGDPLREVRVGADEVRILGHFHEVPRAIMSPSLFLGFRLFSLTLGRVPAFAIWLKSALVRALITRQRELGIHFARRVRFTDDLVEVEDRIDSASDSLEELIHAERFATIHMGSSRYFVPHELADTGHPWEEVVDVGALRTGIVRRRRIVFD